MNVAYITRFARTIILIRSVHIQTVDVDKLNILQEAKGRFCACSTTTIWLEYASIFTFLKILH